MRTTATSTSITSIIDGCAAAPPPLSRIHRPPHDDANSLGGLTAQEGR